MPLGIDIQNLSTRLRGLIFSSALQRDQITLSPGVRATNTLRLAANVADTETVVIGADTYEIETVATAIGGGAVAAGGTFNSTADPKQITITAHGLVAGDLIACQTEICQVQHVVDANSVVVTRGRYGTTAATHADGQTINKGNGITAGRIPVGFIATFTPAVAGPALVDAINNPLHGAYRPVAKSSTIFAAIQATSLQAGAEVLLEAVAAGVDVRACTETLAGANNAFSAAAMFGGQAAGVKKRASIARVPTATEVALGFMRVTFPFTPSEVIVEVRVTATGIVKAWDGGWAIAAGRVSIDNVGAVDWAATDTVFVRAAE